MSTNILTMAAELEAHCKEQSAVWKGFCNSKKGSGGPHEWTDPATVAAVAALGVTKQKTRDLINQMIATTQWSTPYFLPIPSPADPDPKTTYTITRSESAYDDLISHMGGRWVAGNVTELKWKQIVDHFTWALNSAEYPVHVDDVRKALASLKKGTSGRPQFAKMYAALLKDTVRWSQHLQKYTSYDEPICSLLITNLASDVIGPGIYAHDDGTMSQVGVAP